MTKKLAVLIDADNSSCRQIPLILQEIARYGIASVKRVYGDWSSERLTAWRDVLLPHAITPIQQFAYTKGKDATDMMLIINAMDLLHDGNLDGFCIVSSDSDFTPLASRIRESGLLVYGFGKNSTPKAFINACDVFVYVENLENTEDAQDDISIEFDSKIKDSKSNHVQIDDAIIEKSKSINPNQVVQIDTPTLNLIYKSIKDVAEDDGWANLSTLGNHLRNVKPDFDTRTYGRAKLSGLLQATGLFVIELRGSQKFIKKRPSFADILKITQVVIEKYVGKNQWAFINPLAIEIKKTYPEFNAENYGFTNIQSALKAIESKYFELNQDKTQIRLLA